MSAALEFHMPISGYEKKYEITTRGRVWSIISSKFLKPIAGSRGNSWYVNLTGANSAQKVTYIHRLVAIHFIEKTHPEQTEVDHINRDPWDNRAENLRWATHQENMRNTDRRKHKNKVSRFKGVHWNVEKQKWKAMAGRKHIGYYEDELEARDEYNRYVTEKWGEFAVPNRVD